MSVNITRDGGGISLNAGLREVLRDAQGKDIVFDDEAQAKDFLRSGCGFEEEDIDCMEFPEVKND
jgi:hypothetical protein